MSEIVDKLLEEFKTTLNQTDGVSETLVNVLDIELKKEKPNSETISLAMMKTPKEPGS